MKDNCHTSVEDVKTAARGRAVEILRHVAGIDDALLDGKHHPCPKCGGTDRFRLIDADVGAVLCNQCFAKNNGDFIAAVEWMNEVPFRDALDEIARYLGVEPAERSMPNVTKPTGRQTDYLYQDESGETPFKVVRRDREDGKRTFRQFRKENGAWQVGLDGRSFIPIPYRLPDLIRESVRTVFIVEGEKCADELARLLRADKQNDTCAVTTISGGSNNWKRLGTFADRFYGLAVVLLSDNDAPGRKAAFEGIEALSNAEGLESLSLVEFDKDSRQSDAPPRYDVADWISEMHDGGRDDSAISAEFFRYVQTNGQTASPELIQSLGEKISGDSFTPSFIETKNGPFPIETFPKIIRDYCVAAAISTNVDVSFTALAAMTAFSTAIGRRYALHYRDWRPIRPIINGICIGSSGMGKSPAIHAAIFPLSEAQDFINDAEYRDQKRVDHINIGVKPSAREPYRQFPKILLTDTTTESLYADLHNAEVLKAQHGLLGYYDEIALLLNSMDAYKSGSGDLSRFLSITDGCRFDCGRKTGLRKIFASNPHFPIIGGIQPSSFVGILKEKPELIDRGFIPRFLFSFPDPIEKLVSPPVINPELRSSYQLLLRLLLNQRQENEWPSSNISLAPYDLPEEYETEYDALDNKVVLKTAFEGQKRGFFSSGNETDQSHILRYDVGRAKPSRREKDRSLPKWVLRTAHKVEPASITLSTEANAVMDEFTRRTYLEEKSLPEAFIAYWEKTRAYLLRTALLFHVVKIATGENDGVTSIDRKTMEDAVILMNWFRREYVKLISIIPRDGRNAPSLVEQAIVDRIAEKSEGQSKRDLKRMFSRFNKAGGTEALEKILDKLCAEKRIIRQLVHTNGKSKEIYLAP